MNTCKILKFLSLKLFICFFAGLFLSCRSDDDPVLPEKPVVVDSAQQGNIKGFFLLNEGNMGLNKASLDYFDYEQGIYHTNIYPERNPNVVKWLGDVGNDLQIYGDKLYAVINCSHLVEVMDVNTARHLAVISIPNCRYITFDKGYAYVSSYAGPVQNDPNSRLGYVARIDTLTLRVIDTCTTGYQPEKMVVRDNKLYVANSGGYRAPDYDNTVSVIDLNTFREIRKITVAINLHCMETDSYGNIYVSSRGDHKNIKSNLYVIDRQDRVSNILNVETSEMAICGDSLYIISGMSRNQITSITTSYTLINTKTKQPVSRQFIDDEGKNAIEIPYGIAVNPETKEIFITDAKDYIYPGKLFRFTGDGKLKKWKDDFSTGDIPAHIAFTRKTLK